MKVRLVWRLGLSLFGQLTLLLILAIYTAVVLSGIRQNVSIVAAERNQLESATTLPALLSSMDANRRLWQKSGDVATQASYRQAHDAIADILHSLDTPLLRPSDNELKRRGLVQQWMAEIGDVAMVAPNGKVANPVDLETRSQALLGQIVTLSAQSRIATKAALENLHNLEATDDQDRLAGMWKLAGTVFFFTILIQLLLSNSIIGPIQALTGVVRRLQSGDYTVRAHLRSGDEIQGLGDTFNSMAENILRSQQELQEKNGRLSAQQELLRNANAGLEERVAEKTEEIQHALVGAEAERAKLQTLIERMPDGLLLLDAASRIVLINDAALGILGHHDMPSLQHWIRDQPEAFSFCHLNLQALPENDIPYRRILRGETFSNVSLYVRGADGKTRLVSFSGAPVLTPRQGQVELSLLLFRDVTGELALRQELEDKNQKLSEAARLKDEFLATLSHELRTPLTPVISCAHLLGTDSRLDPDHLKSVQVIERNARGLSRMIDELLDLSAVMNHKMRLTRESIEMNEWTRSLVELMRPVWEKKELQAIFTPSPQPIDLEIDPSRLAQVLTNLINNAIKYTPFKGHIAVQVTTTPREFCIAVTDNGVGLRRNEIGKIFEMFHQSRTRETQSVGGLGVGLTVARSLAELHGGGLRAESGGLGKGSTFTLWLPRAGSTVEPSPANLTAPLPVVDRTLLKGRRILLVEDSTDTREALERIFQRRGCLVATASNGEEGLRLALQETPDIILSDIGLPGMSGLEFMTQLRRHPRMQAVIAVALSGLGRDHDVKAALEAGFEAHLLKPVDIAVLDQTLIDALEKRSPSPKSSPEEL